MSQKKRSTDWNNSKKGQSAVPPSEDAERRAEDTAEIEKSEKSPANKRSREDSGGADCEIVERPPPPPYAHPNKTVSVSHLKPTTMNQQMAISQPPATTVDTVQLIQSLGQTLSDAITKLHTPEKPKLDPLLAAVIAASALPPTTFDDLNWKVARTFKEPWAWVLLTDKSVTSLSLIRTSFDLHGELTLQLKGLFENAWKVLPETVTKSAIRILLEDFVAIATLVNGWTGDPTLLCRSVAPMILRAQDQINTLDAKIFGVVRGGKAEKIYLDNTGDLRASDFPGRAAEAVKQAAYSKNMGDKPEGGGNRKKGICERCNEKVGKGGFAAHNKICKSPATPAAPVK